MMVEIIIGTPTCNVVEHATLRDTVHGIEVVIIGGSKVIMLQK